MVRRRILEQAALVLSIAKWTALATLTGVVVGAATAWFLQSLEAGIHLVQSWPRWMLLLPAGGLLCGLTIYALAPEAEGHGTERVIAAVHERQGHIPLKVAPVKWLATVITIATGGSAGKEGPCAQIGGSLACGLAKTLWLKPEDRRKLVICGISAGFASVFGTPIAGALFGVEVLFLGQLLYDVLYPSFVAGIISYQTSRALGLTYFHHTLTVIPGFTEVRFLKLIGVGVVIGLGALLLIEALTVAQAAFRRLKVRQVLKPALGALLVLVVAGTASADYLGLGMVQIEQAIDGQRLAPGAFLWKILATSLTLGSGGSGGIITPIFFIGAALGNALSGVLHMQTATLSALGMVALLAGAANTPIAASIMAIEFFGPRIGPDACIVCITAFLASGHRSVYHSQRLGIRKSEALKVPLQEMVGRLEGGAELTEGGRAWLTRVRRLGRRDRGTRA